MTPYRGKKIAAANELELWWDWRVQLWVIQQTSGQLASEHLSPGALREMTEQQFTEAYVKPLLDPDPMPWSY